MIAKSSLPRRIDAHVGIIAVVVMIVSLGVSIQRIDAGIYQPMLDSYAALANGFPDTTADGIRAFAPGPSGVAIAPNGRVYVAVYQDNRVYSWPSVAGMFAGNGPDKTFGVANGNPDEGCINGPTATILCGPESVAVDAAGNLYVADTYHHRILVFYNPDTDITSTAADGWLGQPGLNSGWANYDSNGSDGIVEGFCHPRGVAVDASGNVYVADGGNHRVLIFNNPLTGDRLPDRVLGQTNFANGINTQCGVAYPAGGSAASRFYSPLGVAVDSGGHVYVADLVNNRVQAFAPPLTNGMNATRTFGGLHFPHDVAVDKNDNLYVADTRNNRVLAYSHPPTNDTTADHQFTGLSYPMGMAFTAEGHFVQTNCGPNSIANPHNYPPCLVDPRDVRIFHAPASAPTSTPTPTHTATPTRTPTATTPSNTATPTATATSSVADGFEPDNTCAQAKPIPTDGSFQNRNFHNEADTDWIRFAAQANRTYIIQVENLGALADAVVFLYDSCSAAPGTAENNAFGSTVTIEWDSTKNGDYYIQLRQFDPTQFGVTANYRISIRVDETPPSAPTNPRCLSINDTTIGMQWKRSPERDVRRYRVSYIGASGSGNDDVWGGDTTYYELGGLTPGQTYDLRVQALDFSLNESPLSGMVRCTALTPADTTKPQVTIQQPSASAVFTTTANQVTVSGVATDATGNLSRTNVKNLKNNQGGWDYTLEGSSDTFRVTNIPLDIGVNTLHIQVFDAAGNVGEQTMTITRLGNSPGAVIIIAGHNETYGLQTNIYNSTNRAYRIFKSAGFSDEDIYYLAPVPQDANDDGTPDTDAIATTANFQQAITVWAKGKVGPDKPFFLYMMDHGLANRFCVNGCTDGLSVTPDQLNSWLDTLETETGVTEVTVVYEACVSGSFIQREGTGLAGSISKLGRVIITSTGYNNNAYASAQGAYFSDAFFSCLADSGNLEECFIEGKNAASVTGVNQTPMLDDNGDGIYDSPGDGLAARERYVTRFFSSVRPSIQTSNVVITGTNGALSATVQEGAEVIERVWAVIFRPSFTEPPGDPTLNLNVPVVELKPVPNQAGRFQIEYPGGFQEKGDYRIIFYAQDRLGINAKPLRQGDAPDNGSSIFLPMVVR